MNIPTTLVIARQGDHFLVTVPHYWGRGVTLKEAKEKLAEAGGSVGNYWRVHSVHPSATVDCLGYIISPSDHAPVTLAERNPQAASDLDAAIEKNGGRFTI